MPSTRRRLIPTVLAVATLMVLATGVVASQAQNYVAPLSGGEEVPSNESKGRGAAIFQLSADGSELHYRITASNIHNVHMAHIHGPAAAGANAGIVVWLFPSTAAAPGPLGTGRHDGVLATGTITAANLMGSLAGQPLSALVTLIEDGRAYVNVHTNDGMEPINTGIGDLQNGEIRGQLP